MLLRIFIVSVAGADVPALRLQFAGHVGLVGYIISLRVQFVILAKKVLIQLTLVYLFLCIINRHTKNEIA